VSGRSGGVTRHEARLQSRFENRDVGFTCDRECAP